MKNVIKVTALAAAVMGASIAHADKGAYVGIIGGSEKTTIKNNNTLPTAAGLRGDSSERIGSVMINGGYMFNDYIGVEGRIGALGNSDFRNNDWDGMYGAYLRASYPITDTVSVYALAGQTRFESHFSGTNTMFHTASAGLGAEYKFAKNMSASLEYMRYGDKNNMKIETVGLGLKYKF